MGQYRANPGIKDGVSEGEVARAAAPIGTGQRLIANTIFNFLGQLYMVVLAIAVVPFVIHRIGPDLYGLLMVAVALGGFAGLLNPGIGRALAKYVSELYWQGDLKRIESLFQAALGMSLMIGAVGCVLLLEFSKQITATFFHAGGSTQRFEVFAVYVAAGGVFVTITTDPLQALPVALQRFDISNRMSVLYSTVKNVGMIVALALGFYFKAVMLVYLFGSVAVLLGYVYYARKLIPGLSLLPRLHWPDCRLLLRFSAILLIGSVGAIMVHNLDRVLVAYFLPLAAVAFYVVPYGLANRTCLGVGNITSVIFPSASELSAMREQDKLKDLYVRATKMVVLVALPVTIVLVAVPGQILQYWVGAEFAARSALTLQLLAGGFLFNILVRIPFVVAQGVGRPGISAKYSLLNGVGNVALFALLIPRWGIVGAAWAFFIVELILMPFFIGEVTRLLKVSWRSMIFKAYLPPLACGFAALAILWFSRRFADSLTSLILIAMFALCSYAAFALIGAVDRRERSGIYRQTLRVLRLDRSTASA